MGNSVFYTGGLRENKKDDKPTYTLDTTYKLTKSQLGRTHRYLNSQWGNISVRTQFRQFIKIKFRIK